MKELVKNIKRQRTEWANKFANHISDKGLVFIIYKKLKTQQKKSQLGNCQII